jgi:hypothetical protein
MIQGLYPMVLSGSILVSCCLLVSNYPMHRLDIRRYVCAKVFVICLFCKIFSEVSYHLPCLVLCCVCRSQFGVHTAKDWSWSLMASMTWHEEVVSLLAAVSLWFVFLQHHSENVHWLHNSLLFVLTLQLNW